MSDLRCIQVTTGVYWVEAPEADLYVLCGCPADSVKHLMKQGLIHSVESPNVTYESGPNAILLSDVLIQNGQFSNLAEFPVLQMFYRQGMLLPNHPRNTGTKPILIGAENQVKAQMEYIYRGNYGLVNEEELKAAGVEDSLAQEMMGMKLRFAFGEIRATEDLLDKRIVGNQPVEIKNGVTLRRQQLNLFEFQYKNSSVEVNLNLEPHQSYGSPYSSGYHNIPREYFAVLHSGEGDGWDINRPTMSSIIMFQGRIYLVDAGPNLSHLLQALGIGVNEIEGLFHTHAHDDHFSGLPALLNSDHRIKYYATSLVRASVVKKLSALVDIAEEDFDYYFQVHDLEFDVWNDIDGLEVKPLFSPHPVETNIYLFRSLGAEGLRSYAHFADIISLDVLEGMVKKEDEDVGVSREFVERVKKDYFTPVDIKNLDIGGGLIHGQAQDFRQDPSRRILLSHTARPLTEEEKEIGSGAPFGTVEVLVPAHQIQLQRRAGAYLHSYFPSTQRYQIATLLNNPVVTFNPETILQMAGEPVKNVYLLLTGSVEVIQAGSGILNLLSAGALVGCTSVVGEKTAPKTYRALNFVNALQLPADFFQEFVHQNDLEADLQNLQAIRTFLQTTWLLGESLSFPIQNILAQHMRARNLPAGYTFPRNITTKILLLAKGAVQRLSNGKVYETLTRGDFFLEGPQFTRAPSIFRYRTITPTELYEIPARQLNQIPIVRWKLYETYKKRLRVLFDPSFTHPTQFAWKPAYSVRVPSIDQQHQRLFKMTYDLHVAIESGTTEKALEALNFLLDYTRYHFETEEQLLEKYHYPELELHRIEHERLLQEVLVLQKRAQQGENAMGQEVFKFILNWLVNHLLTKDRRYALFLSQTIEEEE